MKSVIDNQFTYHAPTEEQQKALFQIREAAKGLAHTIDQIVPDCADKSAALRKLREAVMTANAAIVIPSENNLGRGI